MTDKYHNYRSNQRFRKSIHLSDFLFQTKQNLNFCQFEKAFSFYLVLVNWFEYWTISKNWWTNI